jgi:hypothetical protein
MRNPCVRSIAAALLLMAAPLAAAAPRQAEESTPKPTSTYGNRYDIRFMDLHAAEVLAWEQCSEKERCKVTALAVAGDSARKGHLEVSADGATHERIARALAVQDSTPRTQTFQVVLLAAGSKTGSSAADLPKSAQKALDDLRDFLPYKSYQVLDTAWLRTTHGAEGRLVGRNGAGYSLSLRFRPVGGAEDKNLFVEMFRVNEEPGTPRAASEPSGTGLAIAPRAPRDLIETSFGLKEGETIVVGTSKVDGSDEALVVLLTAVPSK